MQRLSRVLLAFLLLSSASAFSADEAVKGVTNADVEWIYTSAGPQASLKADIFASAANVKDKKGTVKVLLAALADDTRWQGAHVALYIVTGTPRDPNVNSFGPLRVDFDKKGVAKVNESDKKAVKEYWERELKK
jgi:hypothetical protein